MYLKDRHPIIIEYFLRVALDIGSSKLQAELCLFGHKLMVIIGNSSEQ